MDMHWQADGASQARKSRKHIPGRWPTWCAERASGSRRCTSWHRRGLRREKNMESAAGANVSGRMRAVAFRNSKQTLEDAGRASKTAETARRNSQNVTRTLDRGAKLLEQGGGERHGDLQCAHACIEPAQEFEIQSVRYRAAFQQTRDTRWHLSSLPVTRALHEKAGSQSGRT